MGCSSCGTRKTADGKPAGCNSNGGCSTGGCNRLNTFNWLSDIPIGFSQNDNLYEISFNSGSRKDYFRTDNSNYFEKNEWVVVESKTGYDVGKVSLRGELVQIQMKKKRIRSPKEELGRIVRKAGERDLEKWQEAKDKEQATMVKARVIARDLKLDMKIGQVEYQADGKKATFFYIADGRVDFRELIKQYAKEFRVKIEMRQIGARQEAGKIGGIGSCGRELCCSTWLNNFKSVSTTAARYQNLAINQSKLSGQCGRLKCCLNYELDSYMDALQHFPKNNEYLKSQVGDARLVKTDIFKGLMWYQYKGEIKLHALDIERVNEILALNKKGEKPESLVPEKDEATLIKEKGTTFEDGSGVLTLDTLERTTKRNKRKQQRKRRNLKNKKTQGKGQANQTKKPQKPGAPSSRSGTQKKANPTNKNTRNNTRNKPGNRKPKSGNNAAATGKSTNKTANKTKQTPESKTGNAAGSNKPANAKGENDNKKKSGNNFFKRRKK